MGSSVSLKVPPWIIQGSGIRICGFQVLHTATVLASVALDP